ncbi:MAG TPA: DUF5985 family protein [Polyangiaceae bacterium]
MNDFLLGALCIGFLTVSMFFARFYRRTRDRFFAFLSGAFALMSANQISLQYFGEASEYNSWLYVVRLSAFLLILLGIWDKNRS